MKYRLASIVSAIALASCGSDSGTTGSPPAPTVASNINVAASSVGATATATFNAASAGNLIDENIATSWISSPGSPILIDFGSVIDIDSLEINKVNSLLSTSSPPDILVELSADDVTYESSGITLSSGADIPCISQTFGGSVIDCSFTPYSARYIRITTQNGKSFEFQDIEAISN